MQKYRFARGLVTALVSTLILTTVAFGAPPWRLFPEWSVRFNDFAAQAAFDQEGNSYLAGTPNSGYPMKMTRVTSRGQTAWSTTVDDRFFPGYPNPITVDSEGNVYVAGVTFAPNPSNPLNYQDFGLRKFSPRGELVWRVSYDPPDGTLDWVNGVGRDNSGAIYVVGRSYTAEIPGAYDTFLKYDPEGHLLWSRRFEPATNSTPHNNGTMAVNPQGGVAAVGSRTVASYSAAGDLLWSWEGPASETSAAFDREGHLYILSSQWTGTTIDSAVIKFSATGEVLWRATYQGLPGVAGGNELVDLKLDSFGNAYVAANGPIHCDYIVDDGDQELRCDTAPLIVKFSPQGQQLWASRFLTATNRFPEVAGLALNVAGEPYLAVRLWAFDESIDSYNATEGLVAKCDDRGNQIWNEILSSPDSSRTLFLAKSGVDRFGQMLLSAELIDYSEGTIDTLLMKLHPDGAKAAPRLIAAPQSQTAAAGTTVMFGVRALGMGRLSYQWRYNSKPIAGATSATLTLRAVQSTNAGDYSVEVRDRFGSVVTPEARLMVLP